MNEQYIYYLYSSIANYGDKPTFHTWDNLPKTGFRSVYAVTKETAEAITKEGTSAGFKGVVWSPFLHLDIDSYEKADRTEGRLNELHLSYKSYDTGGRGAHFLVLRDNHPSHRLPADDKAFVEKHFPEADKSLYTHLHMFRMEGTTHEKTGLVKRLVSECRGSTLSVPRSERSINKMGSYDSEVSQQQGSASSIFDNFHIISNTVPVENGQRHYTLIRLIYALNNANIGIDKAYWWISEWNKMLVEPKSEEEINQAIRSIYR